MHQHTPYLQFPNLPFANISELIFFALVGLACVPFSWVFVKTYKQTQGLFGRLKIPRFLKPALGGLAVGLLAYLCPQAAGTGWKYLSDAVSGALPFYVLLFIACMKILATSLTIGSGGSGGVFGPSLYIGGMVGGAVGFGLHALDPHLVANPGSYVLVGMGAFFAGAAKAPLAGLIMVCEITGNYGLLAPLLIASTLHLALSRKWSIYESRRHDKFSSPVHAHALKVNVLKHVPLAEVMRGNTDVTVLSPESDLVEAFEKIRATEQEIFPVLGSGGEIIGLVSSATLHLAVMDAPPGHPANIGDLMTDGYAVELEMDLHEASSVFLESGASQLPVLGPKGSIVGMLRLHDILAQYGRETLDSRSGVAG